MTSIEIRDALTEVHHAVDVPPVDRLAFQARVRAERRRRTAGRALAAGAAAAAVVAVGAVAVSGTGPAPDRGPEVSGSPSTGTDLGTASRMGNVAVAVERHLRVLQPGDGGYGDEDLRVEEVLGHSPGGVVVVDDESRLLFVPLAADGEPGTPRPLAGGDAVQRAWLDKSGRFLAFVDLDVRLHVRRVAGDRDLESTSLLSEQTSLVATDGTRWVEDEGDRLSLRHPDESFEVVPEADPFAAELAGGTLAVHSDAGVELFDAADGRRRLGDPRGAIGSLSPDGTRYATDPAAREQFAADAPSLTVLDTSTGDGRTMRGYPADMRGLALTWQDDDRFLVLAESSERAGNRVLFDCSVALGSCEERYDDPTGTLSIASQ